MSNQFHYDEDGAFFGYFSIALISFILILLTYYLFKRYISEPIVSKNKQKICICSGCQQKSMKLKEKTSKSKTKYAIIILIISLWIIFIRVYLKIRNHTNTPTKLEFDPFEILGIDASASIADIKSVYRKMVVKKHPDHGGNMEDYIRFTKAYNSLTDEVSRANYEKYGNPDGPQSTSFGIALPSWLVDKKYSRLVLLIYFLTFILGVPITIGVWWYNSKKYFSDQLLVSTLQSYSYFLRKSSEVNWKTILALVSSSTELTPTYCSFMKISNAESTHLQKLATRLNVKAKNESYFNQPFSIKARVLLYSHLSRVQLPDILSNHFDLFLVKYLTLLGELQKLAYTFHYHKLVGYSKFGPSLETVLTCMRLSSNVVQGLNISDSPLLQLPHFTDSTVSQIERRKKSVNSVKAFLELGEKDQKYFLKDLSEFEKRDIFHAIEAMPLLSVSTQILIGDEVDPSSVEMYSTVIVRFQIERYSLITMYKGNCFENNGHAHDHNRARFEATDPEITKAGFGNNDLAHDNIDAQSEVGDKEIEEPVEFHTHSPLFPHPKKEGWWVMLVNATDEILAGPLYFQLKSCFQIVDLPTTIFGNVGILKLKYIILSDTYKDEEYRGEMMIIVTKIQIAEEVNHPQWETISEESEPDEEVLTDSDETDETKI